MWAQSVFPVVENGKWGAIDQYGNFLFSPQYDHLMPYTPNNLAVAALQGKYGVVNRKGEQVLDFQYDHIEIVTPNRFLVWKKYRCGVVDKYGKEVLPIRYDAITPLKKRSYLYQQNQRFGIADQGGKEILERTYPVMSSVDSLPVLLFGTGKQVGVLNISGEILLPPVYPQVDVAEQHAIGVRPEGIDLVEWDSTGSLLTAQAFPNREEARNYLESKKLKMYQQTYSPHEGLEQGVWQYIGDSYYLLDKQGRSLLGYRKFYHVEEAPEVGLALAYSNDGGEESAFVVDSQQGTFLYQHNFKKIALKDYFSANWARAASGDYWDHLISRRGEIKSSVEMGDIRYPIDEVVSCREGVAVIRSQDKYGAVSLNGEVVLPFEYDYLGDVWQGMLNAKKGGIAGVIDLKGNTILPFQYEEVATLNHPLFRVKLGGKWGVLNKERQVLLPFVYDAIAPFVDGIANIKKEGQWGRVNQEGTIVLAPTIKADSLRTFVDGLAITVNVKRSGQQKVLGLVKESGEVVIPPSYDHLGDLLAIWGKSKERTLVRKGGRYGVMNSQGKELIPCLYDTIAEIEQEVVIVQRQGKWGVRSIDDKELLPVKYDSIHFLEGTKKQLLEVMVRDTADYKVTHSGYFKPLSNEKKFTPYRVDENIVVEKPLGDGFYQAYEVGNTLYKGLVDYNGIALTAFKYKSIAPFSEGLSRVEVFKKRKTVGFIDMYGKEVITPRFEDANYFSGSLSAVMHKGAWGYVDIEGEWVIPAQFMEAGRFIDGVALVNKRIIINTEGAIVGRYKGDGKVVGPFRSERCVVKEDKQAYHILPSGNAAYRRKFQDVTRFNGERAFVKMYTSEGSGKWRMIDVNGNVISDTSFEQVKEKGNSFQVRVGKRLGVLDLEGKWIIIPECTSIRAYSDEVIKVEVEEKVRYILKDGTVIYSY
ncbi:hypothetical protein GCM10023331_37300 [Algivirga pacifica]|uniref:WG containing repeat-containing protein n=2 Tax=Algivirga pacifica TaxID=1162670 RepID=A0ABP9DK58_9BACT